MDAKNAEGVTILFIAVGMSRLMSAAMLLFNVGLTPDFLLMWMKNWVVSVTVAYPTALMIVPMARKITCHLTR